MTLVEFLAPLKRSTHRKRVLAVLYFKQRYDGKSSLTASEIYSALSKARVTGSRRINVSDVLARSGACVDAVGWKSNGRLWTLTETGAKEVREALGLPQADPEIETDVSALTAISENISDKVVREYVEEAIRCLEVGAKRACVVFLWAGAVRTLHEKMLKEGQTALNGALTKHDSRVRPVSRIDHFSYVKDQVALLAAQELGILDKSEKGVLENALKLRNDCGHPVKYSPREQTVKAFIEQVCQIVFE